MKVLLENAISALPRNLRTVYVLREVQHLTTDALTESHGASFIGIAQGKVQINSFEDFTRMIDAGNRRPKQQWWLDLRRINDALARPEPPGLGTRE